MTWNDPISGVVVFVLLFLFTNSFIFFLYFTLFVIVVIMCPLLCITILQNCFIFFWVYRMARDNNLYNKPVVYIAFYQLHLFYLLLFFFFAFTMFSFTHGL